MSAAGGEGVKALVDGCAKNASLFTCSLKYLHLFPVSSWTGWRKADERVRRVQRVQRRSLILQDQGRHHKHNKSKQINFRNFH